LNSLTVTDARQADATGSRRNFDSAGLIEGIYPFYSHYRKTEPKLNRNP
jgi:hypothetical protein